MSNMCGSDHRLNSCPILCSTVQHTAYSAVEQCYVWMGGRYVEDTAHPLSTHIIVLENPWLKVQDIGTYDWSAA